MTTVNMHEAKTRLSKLVEAIESGTESEVILARNGKPVARLVPIAQKSAKRRLGLARGEFGDFTLEEFNADDEEIARMFLDGPIFPDEPVIDESAAEASKRKKSA
ncbi:MAG: type II toxin-antitoxin system prevent-host-death family antitoxin [Devosia sp.]|nr:type II toxin-antitoxin system prevent-host-death family antitoxin [Devosia sp.]